MTGKAAQKTPAKKPAAKGGGAASIRRHQSSSILSRAVEANGFVFLSGIVPTDLAGGFKNQVQNVLDQIDSLLAESGTDKSKIVQAMIWVPHIKSRDELNEVWIAWTGGKHLPARACVEAKLADPRILVEIMVTAVK
ncbi:MAG: RidA family protein [Hyphomicrobiaceae bacterium]